MVVSILLAVGGVYLISPNFFGLMDLFNRRDGFADAPTLSPSANYAQPTAVAQTPGAAMVPPVMNNQNSMGGDAKAVGQLPGMGGAAAMPGANDMSGNKLVQGFADMEDVTGPAAFDSAAGPAGCYPRDQLTPSELLPKDPNSVWAQQNPMGTGSLKGKNFLSAGALIGVNTVGQSLRNANYQLRSEPPNPQVPVTVFNNSTIEPDTNRRDLEIS